MTLVKSILIVGGGASGLMAAIAAATAARNAGIDVTVTVLEQSHRVGRSILTAGNGRCNFCNTHLDAERYHNALFVGSVFQSVLDAWNNSFGVTSQLRFDPEDTFVETLFENMGLCWRETDDGWCYPISEKATSVLQVLLETIKTLPITLRCESIVTEVVTTGSQKWSVRLDGGEILHGNAVIMACGGRGLGSISLPREIALLPQSPVLGALKIQEFRSLKDLDGFRIKCAIKLLRSEGGKSKSRHAKLQKQSATQKLSHDRWELIASEVGEVLFRKYGVSGISVFNLSRFAQSGDKLTLDFFPSLTDEDIDEFLRQRLKVLHGSRTPVTFGSFLTGMIAEPLATHIVKASGAQSDDLINVKDVSCLKRPLKAFEMTVAGIHDPSQCQVLRGGLDVTEWSSYILQHCALPGMFAAGEALDVDGPCGGYNLSWAWLSGMVAGNAAAVSLASEKYRSACGFARCGLLTDE